MRVSKRLYKAIHEYAIKNNHQPIYDDMRRAIYKKTHWAIPFTAESKIILRGAIPEMMTKNYADVKLLNGLVVLQGKLTESRNRGREYNHIEDLVTFYGTEGVKKIIKIFLGFAQRKQDLTIKFDGMPTVYYGRDQNGTFILSGKNGWGKEPPQNAKALHDFVMNTGKGEEWRQSLANSLSGSWEYLEGATPEGFRGFVYGDLLFFPEKPVQKHRDGYSFKPNQVTYVVDEHSELGRRVAAASIGLVLHNTFGSWGDQTPKRIVNVKPFQSPDVVALPPTYIGDPPQINERYIEEIKKKMDETLDTLLMSDSAVPEVMYRFTNYMNKSSQLNELSLNAFSTWLEGARFNDNIKNRIRRNIEEYPDMFTSFFELYMTVVQVKNHIIDSLDNQPGTIRAYTGEMPGGEGYVSVRSKVKLIPRDRWKPHQ